MPWAALVLVYQCVISIPSKKNIFDMKEKDTRCNTHKKYIFFLRTKYATIILIAKKSRKNTALEIDRLLLTYIHKNRKRKIYEEG